MSSLLISRIVDGWDMRKRHSLRRKAWRIKKGEVLLAFNVRQTIARFVDAEGGVHDYYAPKGEMFDVPTLYDYVKSGIGVSLVVGASEESKADALRLVA